MLIAASTPLEVLARPSTTFDEHAATNLLAMRFRGVTLTGLRAPAYKATSEWSAYWDWLGSVVDTDIVIGDLNADPVRANAKDRALSRLARYVVEPFVDAMTDHAALVVDVEQHP